MTIIEFYNLCLKYNKSINPAAATAQCVHETRYGGKDFSSSLWTKAFNPAGIKTLSGWKGSYIDGNTWEQNKDGSIVKGKRTFLKFNSPEDGVKGYVDKIQQNYPSCTDNIDNMFGYFAALMNGKYGAWATDQSYLKSICNSLIRIAPTIFGDEWKNKLNTALKYAHNNKRISDSQYTMFNNLVNPTNNTAVASSTKKKLIVVLDPGHGFYPNCNYGDSGAVSVTKKMYEMDIASSYCKALKEEIGDRATVILTRNDRHQLAKDKSTDLKARCDLANKNNATVFVSIHCNSAGTSQASGFEAFTSVGKTRSDTLCDKIYTAWKATFPNMKIRRGNTSYGQGKEDNLYVVKNTNCPAVLVELGFISNKNEESLILSTDYKNKAVKLLAKAILDFIDA